MKKLVLTRTALYMTVKSKSEGDKLAKFFLNSDIIIFLMKITQCDQSPYHKNEYKILNLLEMPENLNAYDLTKKEQDLIKHVISYNKKETDSKIQYGGTTKKRKIQHRFTRKYKNKLSI